ncbi:MULTISPECIES: hypothetical protein [Bacillota]|jgi:hypothetical protein|uniref:Uncharacterized protein n=2 Tax=Amedibacillus TaxID=2749846 RepID=A0A7G9GPZ8_9FIRM|nr:MULTISPECIES: hypothetical protein [Bacillota]QNM12880.1 hypothetical protein H9Q80_02700 [[Eubacterium] hominis]MCH4286761.1 hypothetical protein [Amedibacillus hominis]RGB58160.1 hypothetical protein DW271_00250 [Absiella sp. AM22-9]RGB59933.1 hypothetical protein DW120_09875 [Absiella sp. AM10-20]RGB66030.1 hypothetical protein DW113_10505 [Absiella sp. AM09-45]
MKLVKKINQMIFHCELDSERFLFADNKKLMILNPKFEIIQTIPFRNLSNALQLWDKTLLINTKDQFFYLDNNDYLIEKAPLKFKGGTAIIKKTRIDDIIFLYLAFTPYIYCFKKSSTVCKINIPEKDFLPFLIFGIESKQFHCIFSDGRDKHDLKTKLLTYKFDEENFFAFDNDLISRYTDFLEYSHKEKLYICLNKMHLQLINKELNEVLYNFDTSMISDSLLTAIYIEDKDIVLLRDWNKLYAFNIKNHEIKVLIDTEDTLGTVTYYNEKYNYLFQLIADKNNVYDEKFHTAVYKINHD